MPVNLAWHSASRRRRIPVHVRRTAGKLEISKLISRESAQIGSAGIGGGGAQAITF